MTNTPYPTSAVIVEKKISRLLNVNSERREQIFEASYIFVQVGLLQVYHFKLDPLQNLFQGLA